MSGVLVPVADQVGIYKKPRGMTDPASPSGKMWQISVLLWSHFFPNLRGNIKVIIIDSIFRPKMGPE